LHPSIKPITHYGDIDKRKSYAGEIAVILKKLIEIIYNLFLNSSKTLFFIKKRKSANIVKPYFLNTSLIMLSLTK
jgi:hypothetical protein